MRSSEKVVRDLYAAFDAADMDAIGALFSDDVVWHAPGRGKQAGDRKGKQELFAVMGALAQLTGGTLRGEVRDVLVSDVHVAVIQRTTARREGFQPLEDDEIIVYAVRDGRIAEAWEYPGDLYAMDAFFA